MKKAEIEQKKAEGSVLSFSLSEIIPPLYTPTKYTGQGARSMTFSTT